MESSQLLHLFDSCCEILPGIEALDERKSLAALAGREADERLQGPGCPAEAQEPTDRLPASRHGRASGRGPASRGILGLAAIHRREIAYIYLLLSLSARGRAAGERGEDSVEAERAGRGRVCRRVCSVKCCSCAPDSAGARDSGRVGLSLEPLGNAGTGPRLLRIHVSVPLK